MTPNRILVVDDDVDILRHICSALTTAGYEAHAAVDGALGFRRFQTLAPELVLIDIIMPNREGIETIIAMRQARPRTKIIAMSGGGRIGPEEFLKLARHLGADAVLAKPFRLATMVALVRSTLGAQSARAELEHA